MLKPIRLTALFAIALVVSMVVIACGSDEEEAATPAPTRPPAATTAPAPVATTAPAVAPTATPTRAPTATSAPTATPSPKTGGTLRVGAVAPGSSVSPLKISLGSTHNMVDTVYSRIVVADVDDNTKLVGDLAESWQITDNGATYTFKLKTGVRWHDGKTFTASDAKGSLDSVTRTDQDPFFRGLVTDIASTEAPDAQTFIVKLKEGSGTFVARLKQHMVIRKDILDARGDLETNFVGTGPFKFSKFDRNTTFEAVRNADYFARGVPYLDGITQFFIADVGLRSAAIRSRNLDIIAISAFFLLDTAQAIKAGAPQVSLDQIESDGLLSLLFQTDKAPWGNINARKAFHLAYDRQKAVLVAGQGIGKVRILPVFGEFSVPDADIARLPGFRTPKDADLAEAKRLWDSVGASRDLTVAIKTIGGRPSQEGIALIAGDALKSLGVNFRVDPVDVTSFTADQRTGNYELMAVNARNLIAPDPAGIGAQFQAAGTTALNWKLDPRVAALYQQQNTTTDAAQRVKFVRDLQTLWLEILPSAPSYADTYVVPRWDYVKGVKLGIGQYNNQRHDTTWLDR